MLRCTISAAGGISLLLKSGLAVILSGQEAVDDHPRLPSRTIGLMLVRCQACVNRSFKVPFGRQWWASPAIEARMGDQRNFATTRGEARAMVTTEAKVRENGKANGAREVDTICGFCGVGCGLTLKIEDDDAAGPQGRRAGSGFVGRGPGSRREQDDRDQGRARSRRLRAVQLLALFQRAQLPGREVRAAGAREQQHRL